MRGTLMALAVAGLLVASACGQDDSRIASRDSRSPQAENASASRRPAESTTTTTSSTTTVPVERNPGTPCGTGAAVPVASTLSMRPADAPPECLPPEPEPRLGTGDVQVTLRWSSAADLDLHVTEPDGTELWYQNRGPSATGGRLDVDSNVGCNQEASVENVFWPGGQAPQGSYAVEVVGYQVDDCGSGDYTVTAMVRGQEVLLESGTVGEDESDTYDIEA